MNIIMCPHCQTRVVAIDGSVCPACQENVDAPPAPPPPQETLLEAEARERETEREGPLHRRVSAIDAQFDDLRIRAIADLRQRYPINALLADQICRELLPQYVEIEQALQEQEERTETTAFERLLRTRKQSWERLAEAMRDQDGSLDLLEEHLHFWEESKLLSLRSMSKSVPSSAPTGARLISRFEKELAAFTPTPWGTPALVVANFVVFVIMLATGVHFLTPSTMDLVNWGGNYGPMTIDGQWWRTVTSMFLHIGVIHIVFNMWVLLGLGRLVERLVGTSGFLLLYFASGIAGSLCSVGWNGAVVSAGASGAIFGVGGALVGLIARNRGVIPSAVVAQLRSSIGAFLLYNLVLGAASPSIDMAAHLGGLCFGIIGGLLLSQPLTVHNVARRSRRNALLLCVSVIGLPLMTFALPARPNSVAQITTVIKFEDQALAKHNAMVRQLNEGQLTDAEFADVVESEILPEWTRLESVLQELVKEPIFDPSRMSKLLQVWRLRGESWRLNVDGIREGEEQKIAEAFRKWDEAEELMSESQ